jgi:protocatechuate 4,5-dioxygenase alpha chain
MKATPAPPPAPAPAQLGVERDYHDIPGTYVFDGQHNRLGYQLNMFCKTLDLASNRELFRQDPAQYLDRFPITDAQRRAVLERDWLGMLRLGGNIYYTFKLAIFDGMSMQHAGAAMSGTGMTVEDFRAMMAAGGRPIEGNRSRLENSLRQASGADASGTALSYPPKAQPESSGSDREPARG